jgi:disulfide bond formation protein DsbB
MLQKQVFEEINLLDVLAIVVILLLASIFQFVLKELPCPLCLLQRVGLLLMSIGFLMNVRFGPRPSHYAISIIAALFTASVSIRQILLHIDPATGAYGDPFLGLHLYTWVFIIAVVFILWTAFQLLFARQFKKIHITLAPWLKVVIQIVFILVLLICALNIVTTYMECGFAECPENPTIYKII